MAARHVGAQGPLIGVARRGAGSIVAAGTVGRVVLVAGLLAGGLASASPGVTSSPVASADPAGPAEIIGGTSTQVGQYPSVVGILVGNNLCTGTLIAPDWILTAAHCVDPNVTGLPSQEAVTAAVQVHFATVNILQDPGEVASASATFKNPLFDKTKLGRYDIGLIKLARSVTNIVPSPINLEAALAPPGTSVTMVGYGSTERGAQGSVGIQFELKGRRSVKCPTLDLGSDDNLLCFPQDDNKGTCQGDSGGPAFAMINGAATVVGVTSFGDTQCAEFGADTRIDIERPFLVQHVPEVVGCIVDEDCPDTRACFARKCIAEPFGPNGLGTACTTSAECDSSQCAESSQDGKRCSFGCSVSSAGSCPDGFECLRAEGDLGACWPAEGGGCCDAGGAGGPGAILLGVAVIALGRRRRR